MRTLNSLVNSIQRRIRAAAAARGDSGGGGGWWGLGGGGEGRPDIDYCN